MIPMKHRVTTVALALLLALPALAAAAATTYNVDPVHSTVGFKVRHFVTSVPGRFNDFAGTIVYDPENPAASKVEFTVQAASLDTRNERRDGHLKSADFFDVEKHPTLTFKSKKVSGSGDALQLTGDLTIRGVTKEVTVPVEVLGTMGAKAGFATEFKIDRTDFGVAWNRAAEGGGSILGDEVTIRIDVEADKVEPAAPAASE
jgi:polyisoprenoid-binding protein YceI